MLLLRLEKLCVTIFRGCEQSWYSSTPPPGPSKSVTEFRTQEAIAFYIVGEIPCSTIFYGAKPTDVLRLGCDLTSKGLIPQRDGTIKKASS